MTSMFEEDSLCLGLGGGGLSDTTYLRNITANFIAFKTWVDTEIVG